MIKCFHKAADSKIDDACTRTLCLFLLAFLLVFFFILFISAASRCQGPPNKILIIVCANNFQVRILQFFKCPNIFATFRRSSVYCLTLKKVCAINK